MTIRTPGKPTQTPAIELRKEVQRRIDTTDTEDLLKRAWGGIGRGSVRKTREAAFVMGEVAIVLKEVLQTRSLTKREWTQLDKAVRELIEGAWRNRIGKNLAELVFWNGVYHAGQYDEATLALG
jgi:hypothetical protein